MTENSVSMETRVRELLPLLVTKFLPHLRFPSLSVGKLEGLNHPQSKLYQTFCTVIPACGLRLIQGSATSVVVIPFETDQQMLDLFRMEIIAAERDSIHVRSVSPCSRDRIC